jgi:8-oxo-dGTP pyrophosphatase MutT (NUDIX family)
MNHALPQQLAARLGQPLPDAPAAAHFARPLEREGTAVAPPDARAAAVLLLLYPHEARWHLPLTLRPAHLPAHAGQVSLPGGAVEPGETTAQAAVREFHEELGDDGQPIRLLGLLSSAYVQASNYLVTPWVAAVESRPALVANPAEVAEILEVPLAHLFDPANFGSHPREFHGQVYVAPHFLYQTHRIWGATYKILGELVTVLEGFQIAL